MPQSHPARTRLVAVEPFGAPPEKTEATREALGVLARVRFASEDAFLSFIAPLGLSRADLAAWCAAGFTRRGAVLSGPEGEPMSYLSLGMRGVRELARTGSGPQKAPGRAQASYKRLHDIELGDFGLAVFALARDARIALIGVQFDDKRLTTSAPVQAKGSCVARIPLQADAFVLTRGQRGPMGLLVELDRGTTSPNRLKDKYAGYLAWMRTGGAERDFGVRAMRVVTIVPPGRRLDALHAAALEANGRNRSGFLLFVERSWIDVRESDRLLGPVARPLGNLDGSRVALFEPSPGSRDPQAVAPSGGNPPGCEKATRFMPGAPETSNRPPAATARTQALVPWSAPDPLARGSREALPRGTGRGCLLAGGRRPGALFHEFAP
jgi:hypothetical protein